MQCKKKRKYLQYFQRNVRNSVNIEGNFCTKKNNMHCTINPKYFQYFERNPRNIVDICAKIYTQKSKIIYIAQ